MYIGSQSISDQKYGSTVTFILSCGDFWGAHRPQFVEWYPLDQGVLQDHRIAPLSRRLKGS